MFQDSRGNIWGNERCGVRRQAAAGHDGALTVPNPARKRTLAPRCSRSRYHLLRVSSARQTRLGTHYVPIPVARLLSEMPNYVSAEEPEASSGAIIEGRDIESPVVADLGADLDLWADPMLPAGRDVDVARRVARALALHVIVKLGAHRE